MNEEITIQMEAWVTKNFVWKTRQHRDLPVSITLLSKRTIMSTARICPQTTWCSHEAPKVDWSTPKMVTTAPMGWCDMFLLFVAVLFVCVAVPGEGTKIWKGIREHKTLNYHPPAILDVHENLYGVTRSVGLQSCTKHGIPISNTIHIRWAITMHVDTLSIKSRT